jgi:quercetin dioxygenase-like cupin family protein
MANIFEPEWVERDQPPLIGRAARVGPQAGAERLGATLYEIDPGGYGSPFHLHHGNEELIIVLAGRPSLRTLDGIRELEPGDVVACPVGAGRASAAEQQRRTGSRARHQHNGLSRDRRAARQRQDPRPHTAPPGTADRLALAFPREAQVDRLAGELRQPDGPAG